MVHLLIRPAIVLFGDSLTQMAFGEAGEVGWASLLSSAYQRRADVLNRGFSGYNSRHCLELVPKVFGYADNGILFSTVFLGANDAALPGEPQHVPLEEYSENLGKIITTIRERTAPPSCEQGETLSSEIPIIVITPPPVDDEAWRAYLEFEKPDRTNEGARKYGEEAKRVALKHRCFVLDTWELLEGHTADYAHHLSDGLHLSERGNRLVFDGLLALIQKELPHLAPVEEEDRRNGAPGIPEDEINWKDLCGIE